MVFRQSSVVSGDTEDLERGILSSKPVKSSRVLSDQNSFAFSSTFFQLLDPFPLHDLQRMRLCTLHETYIERRLHHAAQKPSFTSGGVF